MLEIGQIVTMKRFKPVSNPKFANHWSGIFRIVDLDEYHHARVMSLYNPTAATKKVHVDQLKPYYRPVGEPAMTDTNFDVDKHILENITRSENLGEPNLNGDNSKTISNTTEPLIEPERELELIPTPLDRDESDNEGGSEYSDPPEGPKIRRTRANSKTREQILRRYSTASVPKAAETTRSGRQIKAPERLNLAAPSSKWMEVSIDLILRRHYYSKSKLAMLKEV